MLQSVRRSGFVGRVAIIKTSTTAASTTPAMLLLLLLLGQISALPTRRFARIANSVTPYWRPWSTPYVPSRLMTSGDATSRQDRGSSRTSSYMYQSGVGSYSAAGRTRATWVAVERLRGGADAGIKSEEWIAEKARLANSEGDGGRVGGDVGEKNIDGAFDSYAEQQPVPQVSPSVRSVPAPPSPSQRLPNSRRELPTTPTAAQPQRAPVAGIEVKLEAPEVSRRVGGSRHEAVDRGTGVAAAAAERRGLEPGVAPVAYEVTVHTETERSFIRAETRDACDPSAGGCIEGGEGGDRATEVAAVCQRDSRQVMEIMGAKQFAKGREVGENDAISSAVGRSKQAAAAAIGGGDDDMARRATPAVISPQPARRPTNTHFTSASIGTDNSSTHSGISSSAKEKSSQLHPATRPTQPTKTPTIAATPAKTVGDPGGEGEGRAAGSPKDKSQVTAIPPTGTVGDWGHEGGDRAEKAEGARIGRRPKTCNSPSTPPPQSPPAPPSPLPKNNPSPPPRAGVPPLPSGLAKVSRPWGRSGAVAPPPSPPSLPSPQPPPRRPGVTDGGSAVGAETSTLPSMFVTGEERVSPAGGRSAGRGRSAGGVLIPGIRMASAPGGRSAASTRAGTGDGRVVAKQQQQRGQKKRPKMRWQPKYVTVKAVFFLFYSSLGAIMPYLPVYYHSLKLSDSRIGHLGAITPAMTFVFTPLWGAVTDKSGMLKQILVLTFASSALLRVCLAARTSYLWIVTLITLTAIMNAPVRPLLDSGALQILDDRSEYGKQRLWGQWGFGIGSFLTGRMLASLGFKAAFYVHAAFSVPTLLILLRFNPKKKDAPKKPPKFGELYQLVTRDPDVMVFFAMVFAIGLSSGVIENFAYKRLRELGGTGSVLGVSRLVSSLAGIPMFYFSGALTRKMSIVGVLTASMVSYIARFIIYACIKNPWAGLPAEALRGVTFAGFWAASTCHVGTIAPQGLSTTMHGLLNATYGGLGQSLGSLIGGSLSAKFGTARTFVLYAGVDGLLLLGFIFWGLHPKGQNRPRGGVEGSPVAPPSTPPPHGPPTSSNTPQLVHQAQATRTSSPQNPLIHHGSAVPSASATSNDR